VSAFRPFEKEEKKKLKNWKRIWFAIKSNKHQRKKQREFLLLYIKMIRRRRWWWWWIQKQKLKLKYWAGGR